MKVEQLEKLASSIGLLIKIQVRETLGLCFFRIVIAEQQDNIIKIWAEMKGGILQYLDDIPKEKNLFEGECYVFDKRVALDQELEKGSYSIFHECGMPISIQDQERKEYRKGIQCHFCIDQFSDDDRKRFEERQKQIDRLKVENHKIYKD